TECEPVNRQGSENRRELGSISAERIEGDDPFDLETVSLTGFDVPEWDKLAVGFAVSFHELGDPKQVVPKVFALNVGCGQQRTILMGNLLSDHQALEPIDPSLTLFQVDGVAGKVPVDDFPAVLMEVQALLPNRSRGEDERTEGRVEVM